MNSSVPGTANILILRKVRTAGVLCAVGGAGWLANALLGAAISRPNSAAFVITEVLWTIIQVLLLIGVIGLALSGVVSGW
ncbi:MAG: hypothetical protein M3P92_11100, partial [Actinomycetota bacterium]|nr:hypothetical protein [Actinomycetota bacterium]